jgi:GTPase SAR1 family protein
MKLAILIQGEQNSGKTSTIRELINRQSGKTVSNMRKGWQRIFLNQQFGYLKLDVYCVPASPSETNIKLGDRFQNWNPEVLIVAEQPSGRHYADTLNFLNSNNYNVLTFTIANTSGSLDWERFTNSNRAIKLGNRVNQIVTGIRQFITSNNLI